MAGFTIVMKTTGLLQGHTGTGRPPERLRPRRPSQERPCRERSLDAGANFAAMATFTTPETPEPVPLELAESGRARRRGLLGRDGIEGAMLLTPASSVHTFGMRFAIDVAYLDGKARVRAVRTMRPGRVGLPRPWARSVLEAEAGALERWGVRKGVRLSIRADGKATEGH